MKRSLRTRLEESEMRTPDGKNSICLVCDWRGVPAGFKEHRQMTLHIGAATRKAMAKQGFVEVHPNVAGTLIACGYPIQTGSQLSYPKYAKREHAAAVATWEDLPVEVRKSLTLRKFLAAMFPPTVFSYPEIT